MPHGQKLKIKILTKLFLSVLLVAAGCANHSDSDSGSDQNEDILSFSGEWVITETYTDCDETQIEASDIWTEIVQNEGDATLIIDEDQFSCEADSEKLQCAGQVQYDDELIQEYSELNLKLNGDGTIYGDAKWTIHQSDSNQVECSGTSAITGQSAESYTAAEEGAIRVENNTTDSYALINIVPCEVSSSPWGPNQMLNDDSLDPSENYQINGIPQGCYSVRACSDTDVSDNTNCIVYHQNIYVEEGELYSISLDAS